MAKKKQGKEEALDKMQAASRAYEAAEEKKTAAGSKLSDAISDYAEAVKDEVFKVLRALKWSAPKKGRGARSDLEADFGDDRTLVELTDYIKRCDESGSRYGRGFTFGDVGIWFPNNYYESCTTVRATRTDLLTIDISLKRAPKKDQATMAKMLAEREMTPDQLDALLRKGS